MSNRRLSRLNFESDSDDEFASASEGDFESIDEQENDDDDAPREHEHDTNNAPSPSATNRTLLSQHAQAPADSQPAPIQTPAPAVASAQVATVEKPAIAIATATAATEEQARLPHESSSLNLSALSDAKDTATATHPSSSFLAGAPRFTKEILPENSPTTQPMVNTSETSPFFVSRQKPMQSANQSSLSADPSNQEYLDRLFGPPPPSSSQQRKSQAPSISRTTPPQNSVSSTTPAHATSREGSEFQNNMDSQAPPRLNGSVFGDVSHMRQPHQLQQQQHQQTSFQNRSHDDHHGQQGQQQQRGWGSFSSWINTAVSTVSEVIENPNVVVSKAQTISKGIRTVASEQIDRVYESLDPEYEYDRERVQKTQSGELQDPSRRLKDGPMAGLANRRSHDGGAHQQQQQQQSNLQQPPMAARSSAALPPAAESRPERDVRSLSLFSSSPSLKPASPSSSLLSSLSVSQDIHHKDASKDGWADDGWGDQWDDNNDSELLSSLANNNTNNDKSSSNKSMALERQRSMSPQQPSPTSAHQPPRPLSSHGQRSRSQLEVPQPATYQEAILGRGGSQSQGQGQGGQLRRPSTEIRPADAIFSTLDFASNALGNAVLGVHRKVTQANTKQRYGGGHQDSSSGLSTPASGGGGGGASGRTSPHLSTSNVSSPELNTKGSGGGSTGSAPSSLRASSDSGAQGGSGERKGGVRLNPVDIVGGNVVSTGLGALESLGKKAVDVIADVRRAGHHGNRGGSSSQFEYPDDMATFRIPPRMEIKIMFDDTNGPTHLASLRSISSAAQSRFMNITSTRMELFEMAELAQVEKMLSFQQLQDCIEETQIDLLASHKDFRAIVALLENMGVQGTTILRHLRNSTRKLGTLPQDSVHAFEQEWFNHQSRASEKDFFARVPIKRFFEARLMNVYFDGLKAIVQFTEKSCEQVLRLAENFNIRVAEKNGQANPAAGTSKEKTESGGVSSLDVDSPNLSPIDLTKILRAFMGKLLSEARFVAWTYGQCMDAILQASKGFTTPLQGLDWDELLAGVIKLKRQLLETDHVITTELICKSVGSVVDIFKYELASDVVQGRLKPTFLPKPTITTPAKTTSPAAGAEAPALSSVPAGRMAGTTKLATPASPTSNSAATLASTLTFGSGARGSAPLSDTLPRKPVPMAKTTSASSSQQQQQQQQGQPASSQLPSLSQSPQPSATATPIAAVGMQRRPSTPASPVHRPPPPRAKTPVGGQSPKLARPPLPSPTTASFNASTTVAATTSATLPPRTKTPVGGMSPEVARPPLLPMSGGASTSSTLRQMSSSSSLNNSGGHILAVSIRSVNTSAASSPSISPIASPQLSTRTATGTRKMSLGARRIPAADLSTSSTLVTEPVPTIPPLSASTAMPSSGGARVLSPPNTPPTSSGAMAGAANVLAPGASPRAPSPRIMSATNATAAARPGPSVGAPVPTSSVSVQQQPKGKVVGTPIARPPPPKKVPLAVQKKLEDDDFFSMLNK